MLVPHVPVGLQVPFTVALSVVVALGGSVLLVHMGCLSARLYIPDAASCAIAGTFLGLLVYLFVVWRIPAPWGGVLCALLPLANLAIGRVVALEWPCGLDFDTWTTFHDRGSEWPLFLYKVALPFFCIGLMVVALFDHLGEPAMPTSTLPATLGVLISVLAAYLVLTSAIASIRRHVQSYSRLFAMLTPLVSLIAIPLYNAGGANGSVDLTVLIALAVIVAFAWSFLGATAVEYLLSPLSIFALGVGSLALGVLVGSQAIGLFDGHASWFFPVMALVCLLMCLGLIPAHPAKNLAYSAYGTLCTQCNGVCAGNMGDAGAPLTAGVAAPAAHDPAEKGLSTGAWAVAAQTFPDSPEAAPSPADHGLEGERAHVAAADLRAGDLTHDGSSSLGKGRFIRRCERVADLYQLSPREHEVLILLAKGRSMNYIKDALVVSEGTAKTHIRHIYRKTNVHSRHELVELIESIDEG
jgi:DNA-binding CsgD family transcriptional regulator